VQIAACDKPARDATQPASETSVAVKRSSAAVQRVAPALPEYSDANPPGAPHLSGEVQTDRGVSYIDEVAGSGQAPEQGKLIKVHYTGWLTDGTRFDSSRDRDPIVIPFGTGSVIEGWDIGLESMRVGGKRRLIIPAELGYGEVGAGNVIPPDATLVFDVELVAVN
jgi:peptidylprolyl isomerase